MPVCWCGYCDESFYRPKGTSIAKRIICDGCIESGNHNGEPNEPGFHAIEITESDPEPQLIPVSRASPGPDLVCWEHQAKREPIRLSFPIKVF